jgi:deoxycytidylate deaminase
MKFAVACLLGATSAIALNDAPPYFNEPDWRETFPSAAGLVQTSSACAMAGQAGVSCLEENNLFAVGMLGDEDLGEDITMHGNPYRFI